MVSLTLTETESFLPKLKKKIKKEEEDLFNFGDVMITNFINKETIISEMENIFAIDSIVDDIKFIKPTFVNIEIVKEPEPEPELICSNEHNICPICKVACKIYDTFIICESCGMERIYDIHSHDQYSMTIEDNYNTANNSFMTFNIIGKDSYCYNRSYLKTCSDYSAYRNNSNKKDIIQRIDQYEGNKPPKNIVNTCARIFDQIKNAGYVYRGNGKWGVIGACLYYASIQHNLTRTPKEVAAMMGIDDKFLSSGDRILCALNEQKVIDIQINYRPIQDYINQYFPILGIPDKYKDFVIHIIARAERKHLHIRHESRLTTKIVGVIYLLTKRVPELKHIKKDTISIECNNISRSTFIKYYTLIMDNIKIMKKSFRKFHIPMESSWRD
jgi:transcription initiation factor TFIIIB Brf1 subunit/transcription initiation factor TFIIB